MNDNLREAWLKRVNIRASDQCWEWQGTINQGYGNLQHKRRNYRAHRLAFNIYRGDVPEGMVLDHLCRNRRCVNPNHLEPVTNRENVLRGTGPTAKHARQKFCKRGHELTPDNLFNCHSKKGWRMCKKCDYLRQKERRERKKESSQTAEARNG